MNIDRITHECEAFKSQWLDFLWLELTSKCNLRCVHCYAESAPEAGSTDVLTTADYVRLLHEAADLGCRQVQFIGGEPTAHRDLQFLIETAKGLGYEFIEVYTNATRLSSELANCIESNGVAVAVSFYSKDAATHDRITQRIGSHSATLSNIRDLKRRGVSLRAGIIAMPANQDSVDDTYEFLSDLGIEQIGVDRVRNVGRGGDITDAECSDLGDLCGSCWRGSLCVSPDGSVSPCIMSKGLGLASVLNTSLLEIVDSERLKHVRSRIRDEIWGPQQVEGATQGIHRGVFATCNPNCNPSCQPVCNPRCSPTCSPQMKCAPYKRCNPEQYCDP